MQRRILLLSFFLIIFFIIGLSFALAFAEMQVIKIFSNVATISMKWCTLGSFSVCLVCIVWLIIESVKQRRKQRRRDPITIEVTELKTTTSIEEPTETKPNNATEADVTNEGTAQL